ncbi:MAG: hypothetical protein HYZ59_06480 [Actinobacteria bacterium]|nr:hypothetical protein [Actinomycetota bacterium]
MDRHAQAMLLESPLRSRADERRAELPGEELTLDALEILAELRQRHREMTNAALLDVALGGASAEPAVVFLLSLRRETVELATIEWREPASHAQHVVAEWSGHLELTATRQCTHERGVPTLPAEAQGSGRVEQRQIEALGLIVEARDDVAQEPGGRGPECPEPEALDIGRTGVEAQPIDDRVLPGTNVEPAGETCGQRQHVHSK